MKPKFVEDWYSEEQLCLLAEKVGEVAELEGLIVEIGCWEGRSSIVIANACYPSLFIAVDTWQGNLGEGENHPTVVAARERPVRDQFFHNMASATQGNFFVFCNDGEDFLRDMGDRKIRFLHLDASHDRITVSRSIAVAKPLMVPGGIICGDDFPAPGVYESVIEHLPGYDWKRRFWWWVA